MHFKDVKVKDVKVEGSNLLLTLSVTVAGATPADGEFPATAVLTLPLAIVGLLLKSIDLGALLKLL